MKTLDDIIKDFAAKDVIGEGEVCTGTGAFVSDFDTMYTPAKENEPSQFFQDSGLQAHEIDFDTNYQPTAFRVAQNRLHDITSKMSFMQEAITELLLHDPRWVFATYGSKATKVNNNLYTIEIDKVSSGVSLLPSVSRVVELHISDDEILTKLRFVTIATRNSLQTELAYREVNFVYS